MSRITVRIRELGPMCICREWTYLAVVFTDDTCYDALLVAVPQKNVYDQLLV